MFWVLSITQKAPCRHLWPVTCICGDLQETLPCAWELASPPCLALNQTRPTPACERGSCACCVPDLLMYNRQINTFDAPLCECFVNLLNLLRPAEAQSSASPGTSPF